MLAARVNFLCIISQACKQLKEDILNANNTLQNHLNRFIWSIMKSNNKKDIICKDQWPKQVSIRRNGINEKCFKDEELLHFRRH